MGQHGKLATDEEVSQASKEGFRGAVVGAARVRHLPEQGTGCVLNRISGVYIPALSASQPTSTLPSTAV